LPPSSAASSCCPQLWPMLSPARLPGLLLPHLLLSRSALHDSSVLSLNPAKHKPIGFSWQYGWLCGLSDPHAVAWSLQAAAAYTVGITLPECNRQLTRVSNQSKFHCSCHHTPNGNRPACLLICKLYKDSCKLYKDSCKLSEDSLVTSKWYVNLSA